MQNLFNSATKIKFVIYKAKKSPKNSLEYVIDILTLHLDRFIGSPRFL